MKRPVLAPHSLDAWQSLPHAGRFDVSAAEVTIREGNAEMARKSEFKHSVYLAAPWSQEHDAINYYVVDKLANDHDLLVVGDHKVYRDTKHERGLGYRDRVEEILETCSGMVVVLPKKEYPQTTAPFIFLELLLAIKHNLPVLLVCEEGVEVTWSRGSGELTLNFGDTAEASDPVSVDDVIGPDFTVPSLKFAHSVVCPTRRFLNDPLFIPSDPTKIGPTSNAFASLIEEYTSAFEKPQRNEYVFNIMPYAKPRERRVVADAVLEETGLPCINGSDTWSGAPFSREEICDKITEATFVIADLSGISRACIFEVGVAVGSGRDTFIITSTPRKTMPFGVDRLHRLPYKNEMELDAAVRNHCRPYRRRNFNFELSQRASKSSPGPGAATSKPVVLLVHGIRTQGEWQELLRREVLFSDGIEAIPIKYGFLDAFRFWFPIGTRRKAISTLKWKINGAIASRPGRDIVVIAHSFGTYAVSRILGDSPDFRPQRILFCGSIVKQSFRWDKISECPPIVNDCGGRDIWPVLAAALSWGYGPSGVFGFGTPGIRDRHHSFKHSDYFSREFINEYWTPWIKDGSVTESRYEGTPRQVPYWMSLVSVSSFRVLLLAVTLVGVYFLATGGA
ncbi:hypothetical protein AB0D87_05990 [Streptomyces sp. NPDC048342]|uniref:hypothetical protein n=1 Tax=Streptomyces sp. NPDC048342 TaxID=3154716 RepID=UPI0034292F80